MEAKIYHNPRCSKSRQALAVLREAGIEPEIIKYLDTPPTKTKLRSLIEAAGLSVIDAVRTKEAEFKELGLSKDSSDEELLDAMVTHPRLIERPFAVTNKGVRMARPTEAINDIL
ncbi:arsenate reductase (glutaredoxin) [Corynebacterium sp. c8Ua_99]|uniref:arsenate reductase (glutaredoxin) n=1 Tax=Corynebacterium sp. c8Ua_99 TaxID=3032335 RepID=UPI003264CD84